MAKQIKLSKNEFALVDDDDFEYLNQWKWYCIVSSPTLKYAYRGINNGDGTWTKYLMHRVILGAENPKLFVDHISGNGLDNRKSNLRFATPSQNQINRNISPRNKSGKSGVRWHKDNKQWEASIRINGKWTYLGMSKNLDTAIAIRTEAEKQYYGNFLRQENGL